MTTAVILIITTVALLWRLLFGGKMPKPFQSRACQGMGWRVTFPLVPKNEIREFLSFFVMAFAFDEKEKLKLNPEDQVLQIYRALYPSQWTPDALELETLSKNFATKYGISLESIWHDQLTLGELFKNTQKMSVV